MYENDVTNISRREALRRGVAGAATLGAASYLGSETFAATASKTPAASSESTPASANAKAKSVIQIFLWGGMSHNDTWDPKPESGRSYMGSYTAYELLLPSQRRIRVTISNTDRHADPFNVGDAVTAHWAETAPVVIVD